MDNLLQSIVPYWKGTVIRNETVMCVGDGNGAFGNLQYPPEKILSVKDYTLRKEYEEGADFKIENNRIILLENSSIPCLTEENTRGVNIPLPYKEVKGMPNGDFEYVRFAENVVWTEGVLIYGHQICVTYLYDNRSVKAELFPKYGSVCPRFVEKVKKGLPVSPVMFGDSVGEGCSASEKFNHEPFQPPFFKLFEAALKNFAGCKTDAANFSVGGKTSAWGAEEEQIEKCVSAKPDLLLLHFGINDCWNIPAGDFANNLEKIYLGVKQACPDTEVLFIKAARVNPLCYEEKVFKDLWSAADGLAEQYRDFYTLDMFSWSLELLKTKHYTDVTGNGVNHPNDYLSRLYAMTLVNAFIEESRYIRYI